MAGRRVLIVTKTRDNTADFVLKRMKERRIPFARLNSDAFGREAKLLLSYDAAGDHSAVILGKDVIIPDDIGKVWIRRIVRPEMPEIKNSEARLFAEQELEFSLRWYLNYLPCRFLDKESDLNRARNKFDQLRTAQKLGLEIPVTVIANDSARAKRFADSAAAVVAKSVAGFGIRRSDGFEGIYTVEITPDKKEFLDSVSLAPVCFQEKVDKDYELRVTLVGDRIFACKIDSQKSDRTKLDWRRYDIENTPHVSCELDEELNNRLTAMTAHYNIRFASFDLVVTPSGKTVFLEMNPNSQWVWIEELTGMPITDALIDELIK